MKRSYRVASLFALLVMVSAAAVGCGRVAPRVSRRVAAAASERMASVLARDRARDSMTRAVRLAHPRRVFRYVTPSAAKVEAREGFRAGTHFTARATPGRPPLPATAARRYGIDPNRTRRELVRIPGGTAVRRNKVVGGAPGVGEITINQPLPPSAVKRVVRLPSNR